MKLKIMILATLLFAGGVQAQNNANGLLKKVLDKMTAYKNFKADFSYKMDNKAMDIHEQKVGLIYVMGKKYRIETKEATIISNGKTQWNLYPDSKSGTINDVDTTDLLSGSPQKILSKYLKYKSKFGRSKTSKSATVKTIVISDKADKTYNKIIAMVDEKGMLLKSIALLSKDGNIYTISLSHLKPNQNFSQSLFAFDANKYPGYAVADMR